MKSKTICAYIVEVKDISEPFDHGQKVEIVMRSTERLETTIELRILTTPYEASHFNMHDVFSIALRRL